MQNTSQCPTPEEHIISSVSGFGCVNITLRIQMSWLKYMLSEWVTSNKNI